MATSGSIDFSLTAREVITHALRMIGVASIVEDASGEDAKFAMRHLNLMLKGWQHSGPHIFRQTEGSVALVASTASYALSPRPYRVLDARYRDTSGRDLPMLELTRADYYDLPLKTSTGIPTSWYFDPQRTTGTLYVWPVPSSVTTETIRYTYQRAFEDVDDLANDIDVPNEHLELVAYSLADRLMDIYHTEFPRITERAMLLQRQVRDMDREPVIRFTPSR